MNKKMISIFSMLLILLTACQPTTSTSLTDAELIINDAMDAWNARDVATLKTLFADDAIVCFPDWGDECTTGAEEISVWIEELVAANFAIESESLEVEGDKVTVVAKVWADPTRALGIAPLVTTDVYTIQNGKITNQTSTLTEESSTKFMSAMAAQTSLPSSVVSAFESALNAGDVEAAFTLFAVDAQVTFVPDETYTGAEEIHAWLEQLIAYHFEIEYEFLEEGDEVLSARTTSWSDFSRQLGVAPLVSNEVYTVQDGKIKDLTITLTEESDAKLQAALASLPSSVVMAFSEAVNASELDTVMSLYADNLNFEFNPILLPGFPNAVGSKGDVQVWWEKLLADNLKRDIEITSEMGNTVTTNCMISSDYLSSLGITSTDISEEFVVEDGKIKSHMTSMSAPSLNKLQEALVKADIHETIIPESGEVRISETGDLIGKWLGYLGGEQSYLIFEPDGSYTIRDMDNKVGDKGNYWFENQLLLLETRSPNLYCDKGNASYVVYTSSSSNSPSQLTFHKIIDLCKLRSTFITEEPFTLEE